MTDDRQSGSSGAGSTVAQCDWWPAPCQCSAALEAARETTANVLQAMEGVQLELRQSRATEAELRAEMTRLEDRAIALAGAMRAEHFRSNGSSAYVNPPMHERSIRNCQHPLCAALDAAEQPAPPKTAPRVDSEHGSREDYQQAPTGERLPSSGLL